jgi:hypothetical protein
MDDYVDGEFVNSIEGSTAIDPARLGKLLDRVTHTLGSGFYDASAWAAFDGSQTDVAGNARMLLAATERIAEAGSLLYHELAEDAKLKQILLYINQAVPGTRVTVRTRDAYVPWELLYPYRFNTQFDAEERARYPLQLDAIWGARFAIETVLLGEGDYASVQRARRDAQPGASVNINPTIRIDMAPDPEVTRAVHSRLVQSLKQNGCPVQLNDKCADIRAVLNKALSKATLIYVFCHGSAPPALAGERIEELLLDADCSLNPSGIDPNLAFSSGPVIFLNACHSAGFSPLSFSSFLRTFRRKNALGLIATSFTVPSNFAATFGSEVVKAYFSIHGKSLAEILLDLRRRHLRRGNPVPLFYAVQCQVDLQ